MHLNSRVLAIVLALLLIGLVYPDQAAAITSAVTAFVALGGWDKGGPTGSFSALARRSAAALTFGCGGG